MKLPSLQMLRGVLTTSSELLSKAKHVGLGRPEKDPELFVFGDEATKLQGDYALSLTAPGASFAGISWTYQFYAKLISNVPVLSSNLFGDGSNEFLFRMSPSAIYFYTSDKDSGGRYVSDQGSSEIPVNLRGGYRHYKITYNGRVLIFYIDGVVVRTLWYGLNPPSNGLTFMGRQWGTTGALVEGAKAHVELIRFDWEYIVPRQEDFVFKNQVSLDVARSFFDETNVVTDQFDLLRLTDVFNYIPTPTKVDIDSGVGIIPSMAAATVGGFTASASSSWSGDFPPYKAFSTYPPVNSNTCWVSASSAATDAVPHVLEIASIAPIKFNAYRIADRYGAPSGRFISWKIQGKNTLDTEWTTIHTVLDDLTTEKVRHYSFSPVAQFDRVRLAITQNMPNSATAYVAVGHLQLMLITGDAGKKALRYSDGDYVVTDTPTKATVGNHITQINRVPVKGVEFNRYEVCNRTWGNAGEIQSPQAWVLQGRDLDIDSWVTIDTVTGRVNNDSGAITTHSLGATVSFKQLRLYITETNGAATFTSVGELKFFLDDVWQTPALLADVQDIYSVTYSSSTAEAGWYAFNRLLDTGWVTASKATSASPQWLTLNTELEVVHIVVETSDGQNLKAGPIVDRDDPWIYIPGNGYLVDDGGVKKFVPLTTSGLTGVTLDGVPYLIYPTIDTTAMSGHALASANMQAAPNVSYNLALAANTWTTINLNQAKINNSTVAVTAGKFILPKGKYYGRLHLPAFRCNSFVTRLRDNGGNIFNVTPSGFAADAVTGTGSIRAKMYFEVLVDSEVYLETFAEKVNVASTTATALVASPMTLASLNLFKVG